MKKFGEVIRKNVLENCYRLLSVANVTLKVSLPAKKNITSYLEESLKAEENKQIPEIAHKIRAGLLNGILYGTELGISLNNQLGQYLDQSVLDMEKALKEEMEFEPNQWLFSTENVDILAKIKVLVELLFQDVEHISALDSFKYLAAWYRLQDLYMTSHEKKIAKDWVNLDYTKDPLLVDEINRIQLNALLANGIYGKPWNFIPEDKKALLKGRKVIKNPNQDFMDHAKLKASDILHSFWDTTPYKPAYVISRDEIKKCITLCIRGTYHWADVITDLDAHYLKFSIVRDPVDQKLFLRFYFEEESQQYLKNRLGEDTREFYGEVMRPLTGNEEIVETGYAHAGMLLSAVGVYKEITPQLEEIFSKGEYADYELAITGHSLGGGISTLITFLYLIHPIRAIKEGGSKRMRGYSYGGASALSIEFDKYLQECFRSVICGNDIVPRLSYGSVQDLCKIMLAFDEINKNDPETFKAVLIMDNVWMNLKQPVSESKFSVTKFQKLYEDFNLHHMNSLKLFPMGKTYHIIPQLANVKTKTQSKIKTAKPKSNESNGFLLREIVNKDIFDEVIFSLQMIQHHSSDVYEENLADKKIVYQMYAPKMTQKTIPLLVSTKEEEVQIKI